MFALVLRMTESWLSAPPALMALGGKDPRLRQHRKALVEAERHITAPRQASFPARGSAGTYRPLTTRVPY
jgi:hypothetical protein